MMSSKDVKTALKEAREAIKNKDFQTSLKLCKNILRDDKANYMALVFMGLSLQEAGPSDQAPNAFQKAIELNPSNILAWNGLANYYEKFHENEVPKKLVSIYTTLLELETNDVKLGEICEKLEALSVEESNIENVLEALRKVAKNKNYSDSTITKAWSALIAIATKASDLPESSLRIYEEGLVEIVKSPELTTKKYYGDYLKLLYKQRKYDLILNEAEKLNQDCVVDVTPLEWICKIYNESVIEENLSVLSLLQDKMKTFYEVLLVSQPASNVGLFTKAVFLYKSDNFLEAKELLDKVTSERPGLLYAWVLLALICLKLHFYDEGITSALKAEKLLNSIKNSNLSLRKILDLILSELLSRSTEDENLKQGVDFCTKLLEENGMNIEICHSLIRCYINLENYQQAKQVLSDLKSTEHTAQYTLLNAQLLHREGKLKEALQLLEKETNSDLPEWWYEIGILNWELKVYEKCLVPFLKAAKLDPHCYLYFLYCGHYYYKFNNLNKARRCYEKTFKMNQKCIEAAIELSKIYRQLKQWDTNVNLLESLTGRVLDTDNQWAWLQLGLNYLEQEEYDRAVDTLRFVVRTNPTNHCWESLADAYMARGSYTSALKCYQKAVEITPSLYPLMQIANIKQALGEYEEAKIDFRTILSSNKRYVPALKGLAETCLQKARLLCESQRLASARDCAQEAIDLIITGISERNDLACFWKLAGDSCFLVASLPESYSCLLVEAAFAEGKLTRGNTVLEKEELYVLAERCFYKSVTIYDNTLIWHDLAACFLSHADTCTDTEKSNELYKKSSTIIQHCCMQNPTHWQHWNLMGIVAIKKTPKNYALAQHAFVKAVTIEDNSAVAWCNLGTLYFKLGELKLANQAFSQGQRADLTYVHSWVGQALVAEFAGSEEAMDLFRHSTLLGAQREGAVGYADWVCRVLMESKPHSNIYSIHNMHAIPVACDALTWSTEYDSNDPCAWNMLGFLMERLGLDKSAAETFKKALRFCHDSNKDKCRINYGRMLFKLKRYGDAIDMFKQVKEATFNSESGLALSLFKNENYEDSYQTYEQALHWLTDEQYQQSDLLVALASMAYRFQGPDAAKTLLLQSIQLESPSPFSFYAILVLGLLHENVNLSKLALKELQKLQDNPECIHHYAVLLCYTHLLQGDYNSAVRELSKLIHRHPSHASLWLTLSTLLIRIHEQRPSSLKAAARCAQLAERLGRTNMDVTKVLCISSLASYLIQDYDRSLKAAQQAVHCYPDVAEGWSVLLSSLSGLRSKALKLIDGNLSQKVTEHIRENLSPSPSLLKWLNN